MKKNNTYLNLQIGFHTSVKQKKLFDPYIGVITLYSILFLDPTVDKKITY